MKRFTLLLSVTSKHKTSGHSTKKKRKHQLSQNSEAQSCGGCLHSVAQAVVWVRLYSEEHRSQSTAKTFLSTYSYCTLSTNLKLSKTMFESCSHRCIGWQIFSAALPTSIACLKIVFG